MRLGERGGRGDVGVGRKPSSVPMPWASVMIIPLGRELPHASSDLPGSFERATLDTLPYLVLLRLGFTEPAQSPELLVVSYTTVSPLPVPWHLGARVRACNAGHRRSALCGTLRRVTPPGRYPATCSVEFGLSSGSVVGPAII